MCKIRKLNFFFFLKVEFEIMDKTKQALSSIPLLKTKAGPRDVDLWPQRLKEEYQSLIQVSGTMACFSDIVAKNTMDIVIRVHEPVVVSDYCF